MKLFIFISPPWAMARYVDFRTFISSMRIAFSFQKSPTSSAAALSTIHFPMTSVQRCPGASACLFALSLVTVNEALNSTQQELLPVSQPAFQCMKLK